MISSTHPTSLFACSIRNDPELKETARRSAAGLIGLGVVLALAGIYACTHFLSATLASVTVLGAVLLVAGATYVAHAFMSRHWTDAMFDFLLGALYFVSGIMVFRAPMPAAASLTLLFAVMLCVHGIVRAIGAVALRPPLWGWMLFNGIIAIALGVMIAASWPEAALWVIGLYVGINMLASGTSLIAGGFGLRKLTEPNRGRPARAM